MKKSITYFENPGKENTDELISCIKERLEGSNIKYVAIASSSGETAIKLAKEIKNVKIINVTHFKGFSGENKSDISDEMIEKLEKEGVKTYFGAHAFSGACRGISNKYGGSTPLDIVADTLRMFSHGIKVSCEISLMLADAGLVPTGEEILAIGGRAQGIDSAIILSTVNMNNLFDLKIHEIIAMPRP
ncbi:hypothetical protein LJC03_04140 [Methanobrevibacter sp. OttesenSCG-928-I08]|nr:hypothetical protein [Methanobrevibacter sp. OttesenSCG-928-I08]